MAVYFRHGSNGSYKTAYAVWFEILPALRNGRVVVTNIEGMKPLEKIESLLGEKFPECFSPHQPAPPRINVVPINQEFSYRQHLFDRATRSVQQPCVFLF